MANTIPPPPDESTLYGGNTSVPPPPPENQVYGGSSAIPPPPSEADLYHVPASQRVNAQGQHPNMLEAGIMDLTNSAPWKDMTAAYQGAALNGFGGFIARHLYSDVLGVPKDRVNAAVQSARQDAAQQQQQNAQNINVLGHNIDPLATAAGLAGGVDPTLAVPVPGLAGVAGKIATKGLAGAAARVGVNAAGHAAFGSGADAAYQAADMLDGLQKNFDVNRNLQAAATMGTLGGLGGAIHEVAPFVKQLYEQRNGIDTTPSENPLGTTNPLSGQLTPEQTADYHAIIQTGNESDIHNFFNDKNVTPPSHADIHEWVTRRDGVINGEAPSDYADPMFHPEPGPPDLRQAVTDHIQAQTAGWKNAPEYEVINHTDDIQDPAVRQAAQAEGANDPDALGFVGPDNKVRIFASRIDSPETLNAVLYHESLGHFGLQQAFGDRLDQTIKNLMDRNVGQFGKDVDEWQKSNPDAYNGDRVRAGEEVLANMSNNGTLKPSLMDALTSHVRNFGRKMGLNLSYSDAEVRNIMSMAHDAVINGKGRDVRANGFKQYQPMNFEGNDTPVGQNKFMFTGPKAKNFSEDNPLAFTPLDGITRNEIGDEYSKVNTSGLYNNSRQMLDQVLDHPRLYKEYPSLRDLPVNGRDLGANGALGYYDPAKHSITLNTSGRGDMHSTLLHEVQHAIQGIENIPGIREGTAHMSNTDYLSSPLEKEARQTQARADWSFGDREAYTPKFMRRSDLEPKDVADEAYQRLNATYKSTGRSWEAAAAMAKDSALSPELIRSSRSVGNLDRKLFVYDAAAKEANDKLMALHADGPLTAEDHASALETAAHFNYILGRIENDASQIARGLNALKAVSFSRNNLARLKQALADSGSTLEALADPDVMLKFIKQYQALAAGGSNPNGAANMLKSVSQPYWWQYLLTFRHNMMLSGLSTHAKAVMDMATTGIKEIEEKALALPISAVREGLRGLGVPIKEGIGPSEFVAHINGLVKAALSAQTWKDTATAGLKGNAHPRYTNIADPRIPVVSKVTDLIAAQDTFYRSMYMNANLEAIGAREAKAAGVKGMDQILTSAAARARNPTPAMLDEARQNTENTILMNRGPLQPNKPIVPGMNAQEQAGAFIKSMIFPFVRVQSNAFMNQVIRRSPLFFLDPVTRADLAAGGSRADVAMARAAMGTALWGYYWMASGQKNENKPGAITGEGPENYNKSLEKQAAGWSPNAVHENGRYNQNSNLNLSVNPFDRHNAVASMIAGLHEAYDKGASEKDLMTGIKLSLIATMHNFTNQTYVSDLKNAVDAFTDNHDTTGKKAANFAAQTAKSFLPNATTQAAHILDPNVHDTRGDNFADTMGNTLQSSIPGLTNNVPTRYSVYGEPMQQRTSVTGQHMPFLSNGNGTAESTDPTIKELARLGDLTKSAIVTPVTHSIRVAKVPVKLTTAQSEEYQMYAGQTITGSVKAQMDSGAWQQMTDAQKIANVRSIEKAAKSQVRDALIQKEGWLNDDQVNTIRSQLNNGQ